MANGQIVRDRACAQCGASPITGYKFCSANCGWAHWSANHPRDRKGRPQKRPEGACSVDACGAPIQAAGLCPKHYYRKRAGLQPHPCKGCGKTIQKLKFCSNGCRDDWYSKTAKVRDEQRARERGVRPLAVVNAERRAAAEKICPECQRAFLPTRHDTHSSGPQVFCGLECLHAETRRRRAVTRAIRDEAAVYRKWASNARARARVQSQSEPRECKDCGAVIERQRWVSRCDTCRDLAAAEARKNARQSPGRRADRSAYKARRRARLIAATVERFDPFEIFERDGWHCHMCGCKTPKRLRGSYEDNAPELDHVVPLAAGGEHSRRNCACSCRKCNGLKADKPLGQLRLLA